MFHDCLDILHNDMLFVPWKKDEKAIRIAAKKAVSFHVTRERPMSLTNKQRHVWDMCEGLCVVLLSHYLAYWAEMDSKESELIEAEGVFDIDLAGVRFRGRVDQLRSFPEGWSVWDTKLKSKINEMDITNSMYFNFQLAAYTHAMQVLHACPITSYGFDVVRMPGSKPHVGESIPEYCARIEEAIVDDTRKTKKKKVPSYWFNRYTYDIGPKEIDEFITRTLIPIVNRIKKWWDSLDLNNPFNSEHHYLNSDALVGPYGPCDVFDIIVHANYAHYKKERRVFTELIER